MDDARFDRLVDLRRDLHRHPEPAWREFYTTARLFDELADLPLDELHVGPDVLAGDRTGVPEEAEIDRWRSRAAEAGVDADLLDWLSDGETGLVAVVERGSGPTVALRVDIDGLPIAESDAESHRPAAEGFRSDHEGHMHACGHDAHATIGVGVLKRVLDSDFSGTLKVCFQPAEEVAGGGAPLARSGHLDDVDHLLAVHVGLDHPSGEVVAGVSGFLAITDFRVDFHGESAHAGLNPSAGRNAVQAMAAAVTNLHGIPRHEGGGTRVNAGKVGGGTATNVVPDHAWIEGEVRGDRTELMEWTDERVERAVRAAAEMHDCSVEFERTARAPSAESDAALAAVVASVADDAPGVSRVLDRDDLGGSEDVSYLMQRVQERGGLASYVCVGTDHPTGHHTPTFDVDERSIEVGVKMLSDAVVEVARRRP